ncbi:DUF3077 domain-containing protein [Pseudomonas vranovensis]|uniref:DUF3077 domain-containing protein n=1 Tax=Pseudomonas vranovensis TaxID=321661 RepID=A0A423CZK8_9PSED|nr:DUF3077 domain-containing protein [Pseudomonas vranovensis]ROL64680.1 hypothetical protein BHU25_22630 [Pseudomonas vranovensis]
MTKPVPDPPLSPQTSTTFGSCNGSHDPLFAVRAGVSSEDALIHTSTLLKSAYQTNAHACERIDAEVRGLLWAADAAHLSRAIALPSLLL